MNTIGNDLRFAVRVLRKNWGFTLVATFALGLGIAANTTIFSAVNALLLKPYAFREMDRIIAVFETMPQIGVRYGSVAPANFLDWREQNTTFESLSGSTGWAANLTEGDRPERIAGALVTSDFFRTLGVEMTLGRGFAREEEQEGREPIVILSDGLWQRHFNSDPAIIGRAVRINERNYTVVGVAPPEAAYPRGGTEMWTPFIFDRDDVRDRESHYLRVIGRLNEGASVEQAAGELESIAGRLAQQHPETNAGRSARAMGFIESETRAPRPYLIIMLGAVAFVLLLACANVANLLLLRASERSHEIAVRSALGASRWRITRQLLTESVLLALAGGALGLFLSVWAIDALAAGMPANFARLIPGWSNLGIDWRVLGYTALLSLLTGVIFGIVPALQASKTDLNESLKEGGRGGGGKAGRARSRLRSALVVSEVALSLVLLVGSGLMVRSFINLVRIDPGFDMSNALTFGISLPRAKYAESAQRATFQRQMIERLAALPGVRSVAAVNHIPLGFENSDTGFWRDGQPRPTPGQATLAYFQVVSSEYFNMMAIPLAQGRAFTGQDTSESAPVVIISRRLAQRHFAGQDPIGQRLRMGDGERAYEIVGIAGDVVHEALSDNAERDSELAVYVPHAQNASSQMSFIVRAESDPAQLTAAAQSELRALDPDQPIFDVRTLDQVFSESMSPQRLSAFMFAIFALVALALAAVGIYAVISY